MRRYFLFYGDCYYPDGGFDDFVGSFDEPWQAVDHLKTLPIDCSDSWAEIVDTEEQTVESWYGRPKGHVNEGWTRIGFDDREHEITKIEDGGRDA